MLPISTLDHGIYLMIHVVFIILDITRTHTVVGIPNIYVSFSAHFIFNFFLVFDCLHIETLIILYFMVYFIGQPLCQ